MNNADQRVRVGVIGYGFMGQIHAHAYNDASECGYPCKIIAVADSALSSFDDLAKSQGNIGQAQSELDYTKITLLRDAQQIIQNPDIDLVSICTHTDSHVDLAIKCLQAGKHVLVEKPIALSAEDVHRLASASSKTESICLPAMCMRYWPAWVKMHEIIKSGQYGPVRKAVFHRLGSRPNWATEFYSDVSRSGGVLHDLHIHDTDYIVHCFGGPKAVTTVGEGMRLSTTYHFAESPIHVTAHAAWDQDPEIGFQMRCIITLEHATLVFNINRENQLIVHQGDSATPIEVGQLTGYDGEIRSMLDLISDSTKPITSSIDEAVTVAHVLEAERKSLQTGDRVVVEY